MMVVKFDMTRNKVYNMVAWRYAYEAARKGTWQIAALDRSRFKRRIVETATVLEEVLNVNHRTLIYIERFL